jgi:ADP-heptose:LPS heptosyltransferase
LITGVVHFSSLRDLVLTGAVTAGLGPVTYCTRERLAAVAAALRGVKSVRTWETHGRRALRHVDHIVDLDGSFRASMLLIGARLPSRRLSRIERLSSLVRSMNHASPAPHIESTLEAFGRIAQVQPTRAPWITVSGPRDALILCPASKRALRMWPADRYVELGRRWSGPVWVIGSALDQELVHQIASGIGEHARALAEDGFAQTIQTLGHGRIAVGGDTGLMVLCGAAGIPIVTLFGPTESRHMMGPFHLTAVERPLDCRPCERPDSSTCPVGTHACLLDLDIDHVWAAVSAAIENHSFSAAALDSR